jgi:DNA ligase 1
MKDFAALYRDLDASTSSLSKQQVLQTYLLGATPDDAAWAVYFLAGGKPRQAVPSKLLRAWAQEACGLPQWLFDESYEAVGDLAETIALLLPAPTQKHSLGLAGWMVQNLLPLRKMEPTLQANTLQAQWTQLAGDERLVYFKLLTGGFRIGVSRLQVTQALASVAGIDAKRVAQRLMGYLHIDARPTSADYQRLIAPENTSEQSQQTSGLPYPFFLAHPVNLALEQFESTLGLPDQWQLEWKWDGIRAQLVRRAGQVWLWSRGEELITERFPELATMGSALPDGTVIDGEIVVWQVGAEPHAPGRPQPFAQLQKRIGRKTVSAKLLRDLPVALLAYDLLEYQGADLRRSPQHARRAALETVVTQAQQPQLLASPVLEGDSWADLAQLRQSARSLGVEGMMIKSRQAQYGVGRTKDVGVWFKWKLEPFSVDAVLIYAQRGHGRRASLYSDYTFAVWDSPSDQAERKLVPFAKAYSGLTDVEMGQVDAVIRKTTLESFGPVRSVTPTLVFELGFEGISRSPRHKSGIAVRFPRMLRWRTDKPVDQADTLQTLAALLAP